MCGIFAYAGEPPRALVLAAALRAATRGPHTHGWAYPDQEGRIHRTVAAGRLTAIEAASLPAAGPLVGHARLSTSGATAAILDTGAAQPILSGRLALAHNGVIRNAAAASPRGLQTTNDSEALAALLESLLNAGADPVAAVTAAAPCLDARSPHALAALWDGVIVLARLPAADGYVHPLFILDGGDWRIAGSRPFSPDAKPLDPGVPVLL